MIRRILKDAREADAAARAIPVTGVSPTNTGHVPENKVIQEHNDYLSGPRNMSQYRALMVMGYITDLRADQRYRTLTMRRLGKRRARRSTQLVRRAVKRARKHR